MNENKSEAHPLFLEDLLRRYVDAFNRNDEECYVQDIKNEDAAAWLTENIPYIEIPDKTVEQIYYFRWWVFRKHIKSTSDGYVVTEFLPPVPWAGKHNTIIAAAGHHIAEAKWLKRGKAVVEDYAAFWLEEKSKTYLYSTWILSAIYDFCTHINDFSFGVRYLDRMIHYYETVEREHMTASGLFWSIDNNDAMEYSISGVTEELKTKRGIRPTLNSYMAANALAISKFAEKARRHDVAKKYVQKHGSIKEKMHEYLWDGSFYRAIHTDDLDAPSLDRVTDAQNARELIGYIPWCFGLAPQGLEAAFEELKREDGFASPFGLTTAQRRHPRYLYAVNHECLWNGYIWPFATSQVLNAMKNLLNGYRQNAICDADFYQILHTYAKSHTRVTLDGREICWIDEVKHPETNEWSSRALLEQWGWREDKGGYERGKDYNHSTFCDLVLGGLLGIEAKDGKLIVHPHIPDTWDYFAVDHLWIGEKCYMVLYDRDGTKYGYGKGVTVLEQ